MNVKRLTCLTITGMMLLSGCSAGKTVNNKSVVASLDGDNIYADSIYSSISSTSSGRTQLFNYTLDQLLHSKYPATKAMEENADNMVDSIKESYKSQYSESEYEKQLEKDLKSSGYSSIADYRKKVVYSLQYAEMMKNYVKKHFNAVFDDYYKMATPRYISIIKVSMASVDAPTNTESDKLQEVKDLLKSGKNFGDIAKSYSDDNDTKNAKGSLGIVDTTSSLSDTYGSDVASTALTLTAGQTSEAIKGTNGYYFLYCSSTDKEKIKKELKNVDANSPLITYDNYMVYEAFKTYKITYQDKATKEAIKKVIDENLKNRAEERK